ncbi:MULTISPECIES: hypothetical protein [unclassified Methanoculleus]|uniref:hypothetical protein n=1 Tax=unclassified Methanoculleus TaxID=2619537 RepID=UPI0025D29FCC|nr:MULTISPECIES: hypothetical protein [unclassified Methanoculleus]
MAARLTQNPGNTDIFRKPAFSGGYSESCFPTTVHKSVYPIIKLGERTTYNPERQIDCPAVIIKAQPLVSKDGRSTTRMFRQICDEGGIHSHLDYDGDVILSPIMPDHAIAGLTDELYAELIDVTGVNSYITPDGETYLGEAAHSASEVFRVLDQTEALLKLCPKYTPVGLVKGCTLEQVRYHAASLQSLGIRRCCFHMGDFFRGSHATISVGMRFASAIRTIVPELIIYGIGSRRHINALRFADGFATQSHYVKAFYGYKYEGARWVRGRGHVITWDTIMLNLSVISRFVDDLSYQQGLNLPSAVKAGRTRRVGTTEQPIKNSCIQK